MNGSRVLLVGIAYKADVGDTRMAPALRILDLLRQGGANISYYDPYVLSIGPTRDYGHLQGLTSVPWNRDHLAACDVAIIVTAHSSINFDELVATCPCIVDTRNASREFAGAPFQIWKA